MKTKSTLAALALASALGSTLFTGCKKPEDDAPPPPPPPVSVAPVVSQAPLAPEDPPPPSAPPSASAPKGPVGPAPASIGKCCDALKGNAKNAPPDQIAGYATAIAVCEAARNNPQAQQAFAQIRAALKNASSPPACK